jgi:hypothetical protein
MRGAVAGLPDEGARIADAMVVGRTVDSPAPTRAREEQIAG